MSKRHRLSLVPVAALTALAGCSLATDLDSLSANHEQMDASVTPDDAVPTVDSPTRDSGEPGRPYNPDSGRDAGSVSLDVLAMDQSPPQDAPAPAFDDAPIDSAPAPDAAAVYDVPPADDGGSDGPPPPNVDAAPTQDGPVQDGPIVDRPVSDGQITDGTGADAASDAPALCARLPSHAATLYLSDGNSTATACGYSRAALTGYVAAVDDTTFAGSASCGACLRIETGAGVVVAQVVDQGASITPANPTAVAVNRAALRVLVPDGSTFVGKGVSWRFVQCPLAADSGMTFQFQEGSSANYAALLIQRHRFRLASVEYRSNGSYRSLTRASYNYWVAASGMGTGPFTLRVTDVQGHVVEQAGVPLTPGVAFQGQVQFPQCSNE